jgi:hypothetical protein
MVCRWLTPEPPSDTASRDLLGKASLALPAVAGMALEVGALMSSARWVLVAMLGFGCGTSVTVTPLTYGMGGRVPKRPSQVEIFATVPPEREYVEVALLKADQNNGWNEQGTELMLLRLREAAAELGCDAIVLTGQGERAPAPYVEGPLPPLDYGSHLLYGTCIAFVPVPAARASR